MNSGKCISLEGVFSMTHSNEAVNWTGKLVGCMIFEPLVERLGYKKTIYVLSCIQIVAVTREHTIIPGSLSKAEADNCHSSIVSQ